MDVTVPNNRDAWHKGYMERQNRLSITAFPSDMEMQ